MIARLIAWSARNLMLVLIATFFAVVGGVWALKTLPLDAIPVFMAMRMDRALLRPLNAMHDGKGTAQYRRARKVLFRCNSVIHIGLKCATPGQQIRSLIVTDPDHRALYGVFLEVRDAAAKILESTTVADIVGDSSKSRKKSSSKRKAKKPPLLSIVHEDAKSK